jgi:hypothetical protein
MFRSAPFRGGNRVRKEQDGSLGEGRCFDFDQPIHVAGYIGYDDFPIQRGGDWDFTYFSRLVL